ncbi:MAG: DUF6531 domain-containing protein [Myxococcota bacterium]
MTMDSLGDSSAIEATAINASGQVTGWGRPPGIGEGFARAMGWRNGVATIIGLPGGSGNEFNENSRAFGLNDSGTAVGWADIPLTGPGNCSAIQPCDPDYCGRAVCANNQNFNSICAAEEAGAPVLSWQLCENMPRCVDDSDCPTGPSEPDEVCFNDVCIPDDNCNRQTCMMGVDSYDPRPARFSGGIQQDLGAFWGSFPRRVPQIQGGHGQALAINNAGTIVGGANIEGIGGSQGPSHAFLYSGSLVDLGTLGGDSSWAVAINNSARFVGRSDTLSGDLHAFVGIGTALFDLGTLGGSTSRAYDINNDGHVVGEAENAAGDRRAFLIIPDGSTYFRDANADGANDLMIDIGTLGGDDARALAINNFGEIVGTAEDASGNDNAFLYLPVARHGLSAGMHSVESITGGMVDEDDAIDINDCGQLITETYFIAPEDCDPPAPVNPFQSAAQFENSAEDGDPVNTLTGELITRALPDLDLDGPMPLLFERYYASGLVRGGVAAGEMGENWRHNYEWNITADASTVDIIDPRGRTIQFADSSGTWILQGSPSILFSLVGSGSDFSLYDPSRSRLLTFSGGILVQVADTHGAVHTLTPGSDELVVSDGLGRELTLTYDSTSGYVTTASDGNRTVTFGYTVDSLTTVVDVRGETTTYAYDPGTLLTSTTLPEGNVPFSQSYDDQGRVSTQTDGLGNTTTFSYSNGVTTVTPPGLSPIQHTHSSGVLAQAVDGAGGSIAVFTNADGRRSGITDATNNTRTYNYDSASGGLLNINYPDSTALSYTREPRSVSGLTVYNVTMTTYPDSLTEVFAYDGNGNNTTFTDRRGLTTTFTYDASGQVLTRTNSESGRWTNVYNPDGTVQTQEDPFGNMTAYAYTTGRRISTITYPDTSTRTYTYDADFNVLTETDPNGEVVTYTYDGNGNRATTTDAAGHLTTFSYDALDRLTVIDRPVGMTAMAYDVRGRVTQVSDANGVRFSLAYDAGGRIGTLTDGGGNVWTHTYDAAGRPISTTNPLGVMLTSSYDARGRPVTFVDGRGNSTEFEWDSMRRPIRVTDVTGAETVYSYDAAGDLTRIELPGGIGASYTRVLGQIASITDPRGEVWSFGRDVAGRLISATDPLGAQTTYGYDSMGQNSAMTFPGLLGSLAITRDSTGNITQQSYSDGTTIDFAYDENGRRVSGTGLSLAYDGNGNIVESNGITLARDAGSRVSTVTLAPGKVLTYTYDTRNLVTRIQDWAGGEINFSYDAAGRLVNADRSNGVATTFDYDDNNVLVGINEAMGAVELSDIMLVRDPLGRTTMATRVLPISPTAPTAGPAYTYDAALQIQAFTYDDLGRLVSDDRRDYSWDLASRLTSLGGGVAATDLGHDAWGSLVSRSEGGATKTFVWNYAFSLSAMSIERNEGVDSTYYVHTPDGRLWYSINAADNNRRFYHFDEMGSTLYTTDDGGAMVNAYAYGPYGALVDAMEPEPNLFTYVGQLGVMREGSTGLYHMRRRVYDSVTRRFISREPLLGLLDPRALNPYQYAFNNPQQYADPTGENPKDQKGSGNELQIEASDVADTANWVSYGTEKMIDAAKALNDADIEALAGQRKNILEVAKLQQLGDSLDGVGRLADRVGTAADVVGDGLEIYSVYEDTTQLKNETLTLNDLALQNLNNQTQAVLDLLNKEKGINPARAELLLASVRRAFERTVRGSTASGVAGIELRLWRGIQNTLANRLPPHVQEALKRIGVLEQ